MKKDLKALPSSLYSYLALGETLLFECVYVGPPKRGRSSAKVKVGIACSKDGRGLAALQKSFCLLRLKFDSKWSLKVSLVIRGESRLFNIPRICHN